MTTLTPGQTKYHEALALMASEGLLPAALVDQELADTEEIGAFRTILRGQELGTRSHTILSCPCGKLITVAESYHCLKCGIRLCRTCAERHFA